MAALTCFSEGPESFPWAARHSRAISEYFSFSSSLRSLGRRERQERRAVRRPFHARFWKVLSVGPAGPWAVSPPRAPPKLGSHRALPAAQLPSASPPSRPSSRGWRLPRGPPAGLAGAVRESSPVRRNSRHCGWPCGWAWRLRASTPSRDAASSRRPRRAPALSNRARSLRALQPGTWPIRAQRAAALRPRCVCEGKQPETGRFHLVSGGGGGGGKGGGARRRWGEHCDWLTRLPGRRGLSRGRPGAFLLLLLFFPVHCCVMYPVSRKRTRRCFRFLGVSQPELASLCKALRGKRWGQ